MNCADRSALSQILYVFGNWRPDSWPKNEGRGTPYGCPPPLVGALRRLSWRPNEDAIVLDPNPRAIASNWDKTS